MSAQRFYHGNIVLASACFNGTYKTAEKKSTTSVSANWSGKQLFYFIMKNIYFRLGLEIKPITSLTTFLPLFFSLTLRLFSMNTYGTSI